MDLQRDILFITSLLITALWQCHCACPSCETLHFNVNQNVMFNSAMDGESVETHQISSVFECFILCHKNCLCQSFNFLGSEWSGGLCELKKADTHEDPSSIKPKNGSLFYNLHRQVAPKCPDCSSRLSCCTSSAPCYSNGRCIDSCSDRGRRYRCECFEHYTGIRCQNYNNND